MTHNQKFHLELVFHPLHDIVLPPGFSISADEDDENKWHVTRHTEANSVENYGNFKMTNLTEIVGELDNKKVGEEEDSEAEPEKKPKKKVTKPVAKKESESESEPDDEDVKKV